MNKRPQYIGLGGTKVLLLKNINIYKRLGKGIRNRYTILDRQYIDMADGSNGRQGKIGILDTSIQQEF